MRLFQLYKLQKCSFFLIWLSQEILNSLTNALQQVLKLKLNEIKKKTFLTHIKKDLGFESFTQLRFELKKF